MAHYGASYDARRRMESATRLTENAWEDYVNILRPILREEYELLQGRNYAPPYLSADRCMGRYADHIRRVGNYRFGDPQVEYIPQMLEAFDKKGRAGLLEKFLPIVETVHGWAQGVRDSQGSDEKFERLHQLYVDMNLYRFGDVVDKMFKTFNREAHRAAQWKYYDEAGDLLAYVNGLGLPNIDHDYRKMLKDFVAEKDHRNTFQPIPMDYLQTRLAEIKTGNIYPLKEQQAQLAAAPN